LFGVVFYSNEQRHSRLLLHNFFEQLNFSLQQYKNKQSVAKGEMIDRLGVTQSAKLSSTPWLWPRQVKLTAIVD
jgi:hypothetical protein